MGCTLRSSRVLSARAHRLRARLKEKFYLHAWRREAMRQSTEQANTLRSGVSEGFDDSPPATVTLYEVTLEEGAGPIFRGSEPVGASSLGALLAGVAPLFYALHPPEQSAERTVCLPADQPLRVAPAPDRPRIAKQP